MTKLLGSTASPTHLAANENVEGVAMLRVVGARHGVEGSNIEGVLVHHEEVRTILVGHQVAELLLVLRREVTIGISCRGPRQTTKYTRHGIREKNSNHTEKLIVQKHKQQKLRENYSLKPKGAAPGSDAESHATQTRGARFKRTTVTHTNTLYMLYKKQDKQSTRKTLRRADARETWYQLIALPTKVSRVCVERLRFRFGVQFLRKQPSKSRNRRTKRGDGA